MRVDGIRELRRALERSRAAVARNVVRAVGDGVHAMAIEAQRLAPTITGRLDASIVATRPKVEGGKVSAAVECDGGHEEPIAGHIEFGTRDMAAEPFMRPAFEREAPRLVRRIGDAVRDGLDR